MDHEAMAQWDLDTFALAAADRHYSQTLALPDMRGLTDGLVPSARNSSPAIADIALRDIYAEMIREIQDLLRDIRFCAAVGLMLALDAGAAQAADPVFQPPDVPGLFITEAELAALLTNDSFVPPSTLATNRHLDIGGGQTLGAWFAGLMLDTALVKSHGLLDRLVVALWCRAERPIPQTKAGESRYPSFNAASLADLRSAYQAGPAWASFEAVLDTPAAQELIRYRHTATHKRRSGSELNGGVERWHADDTDTDTPQHKMTAGMTTAEHANAPLATYRNLVRPALTAAAEIVGQHIRRSQRPS